VQAHDQGPFEQVMHLHVYLSSSDRQNRPAIATAVVNGHRRVIARGRVRHRKLTLVFRHVGRGRQKLTLLAVAAHGKRTVFGHTTVAVS
jgi:hypothetical protein